MQAEMSQVLEASSEVDVVPLYKSLQIMREEGIFPLSELATVNGCINVDEIQNAYPLEQFFNGMLKRYHIKDVMVTPHPLDSDFPHGFSVFFHHRAQRFYVNVTFASQFVRYEVVAKKIGGIIKFIAESALNYDGISVTKLYDDAVNETE